MSVDAAHSAPMADVDAQQLNMMNGPTTPQDEAVLLLSSSQISMPSTEGPASPIDTSSLLRADNEGNNAASTVIPSSLTPPPSSQQPTNAAIAAGQQLGYIASQRSGIVSPPATELQKARRDTMASVDLCTPTPQQVAEASADDLRLYLQAAMAQQAKLKMEAAHHKLQFNLLALQADEDAKRASVELEMTRREVDALRMAEDSRQARYEINAASESAHAKYLQLRVWYEQAVEEIESLSKRFKLAKKVIQQKEDELISLTDERDMLLTRVRENREHFQMLCSPGGIFHAAVTPQQQQKTATPVQHRATPRQTPRSAQRDAQPTRGHPQEIPFDVLLKAATQENNSAPTTPLTSSRPAPRVQVKHTRNVQSMSSLPSTPIGRSRGHDQSGLLPSVDLVPQTEPSYRTGARFIPETPPFSHHTRGKSRESTISAEDAEDTAAMSQQHHNEELARQALSSFVSRGSATSSVRRRVADEEAYESPASQAASQMLRRDPRDSFEAAASRHHDITPPKAGHFSTTPAAAEKSAKLQAKLFAGLNKSGVAPLASGEKRKFSGGESLDEIARREVPATASPVKKLRITGGLRDGGRVGLGIRFAE